MVIMPKLTPQTRRSYPVNQSGDCRLQPKTEPMDQVRLRENTLIMLPSGSVKTVARLPQG
ncbi:MAG TPA: hypothetical protein VKB62_12590 [Streptosporangiaceae bacterium]|nr:hypothetical protein [Streptosporangiaceae bacterium]